MRAAEAIVVGAVLLLQSQGPTESVVTGGQQIVLGLPSGFVEVSRLFPDGFRLRQETIPKTNRLLAWLIPASAVAERMKKVSPSHIALQVQEPVSMAQGRHDTSTIATLADQLRGSSDQLSGLDAALDEVLRKPKFEEVELKVGVQRSLGVVEQGTDYVTVGLVLFGSTTGREVSSTLVLSSFFLVRGKVLLLVATGREASPAELTSVAAILGEWRAAFRSANR